MSLVSRYTSIGARVPPRPSLAASPWLHLLPPPPAARPPFSPCVLHLSSSNPLLREPAERRQRKSEERAARYRLLAGTSIFHRVSGNQAFVYGSLHAVAYPRACYEEGEELGERRGEGRAGGRGRDDRGSKRGRGNKRSGRGGGGTSVGEEVRATEKRNVYSTAWN